MQAINGGPTKEKVGWAARESAPAPRRVRADIDAGDPGSGLLQPYLTDYEAPFSAQSILSQSTAAWRPPMRSGDFGLTIRRDLTIARIQDIVRNDPHASSAIDKLVDHIVGAGLRWISRPDGDALGITDRAAVRAFARQMEAEFRCFAEDPRRYVDASRRLTLNGLLRLAARTWIFAGENSYVVTLRDDAAARYATCILTVDPDRICNPYGQRDTVTRRMGVEQTPAGEPVGYWVRDAHLGDYWAPFEQMSWTFVPRETEWGRPVFVHGYEPQRDGDTRGTSPFITLIQRLRMLGRFADNELASATINAMMAATIESDAPADEIAERMTPKAQVRTGVKTFWADTLEWYEKYPVRVGGSRIPVMLPGSTLKFNSSPRQTTAFPAFEAAFLQTIASKLGLAFEQLKMDWSKTNYSSARAALNEVWRGIMRLRAVFIEQTVAPLHYAWADEAFDRGYLKAPAGAPDFIDAPGAYLRGAWIGPPRGYVDPVKEQQASALRLDGRVTTWQRECAEQGLDYEEVFDQLEVETEMLKDRGLDAVALTGAMLRSATADDPEAPEEEKAKQQKEAA